MAERAYCGCSLRSPQSGISLKSLNSQHTRVGICHQIVQFSNHFRNGRKTVSLNIPTQVIDFPLRKRSCIFHQIKLIPSIFSYQEKWINSSFYGINLYIAQLRISLTFLYFVANQKKKYQRQQKDLKYNNFNNSSN